MERGEITNAKIVKLDDGYHVDNNGVIGDVCKVNEYKGRLVITLTENESNRKYYDAAKVDAALEKGEEVILTYKPTVTIGSVSAKTPNEKLIAYLDDDDRAEYMAIIDRARAAMEAANPKKSELTDLDKARLAAEKAKAKYEALLKAAEDAE